MEFYHEVVVPSKFRQGEGKVTQIGCIFILSVQFNLHRIFIRGRNIPRIVAQDEIDRKELGISDALSHNGDALAGSEIGTQKGDLHTHSRREVEVVGIQYRSTDYPIRNAFEIGCGHLINSSGASGKHEK